MTVSMVFYNRCIMELQPPPSQRLKVRLAAGSRKNSRIDFSLTFSLVDNNDLVPLLRMCMVSIIVTFRFFIGNILDFFYYGRSMTLLQTA